MILTGSEIQQQVAKGAITIRPFDPACLTTNSYDFHLSDQIITYKNNVLDVKQEQEVIVHTIPDEGFILEPGILYLGSTQEVIGSDFFVPTVHGKSSTGRLGLFVHITAEIIDIGSLNQFTLMFNATQPVRVYKGMKIGQVTFWKPSGEITIYNGKYKGLNGPQKSQIFKDFS